MVLKVLKCKHLQGYIVFRRFNDDLVLNIVLKGLDLCEGNMIVFVNLCLSFDINIYIYITPYYYWTYRTK